MVAELPKVVVATGAEDVQGIDCDVNSLVNKFIVPIDRIRSISKPPPTGDEFKSPEKDTVRPLESRAHAFMRYIGMPVASTCNKNFYSPGFDPEINENDESRKDIDAKVFSSKVKSIMNDRELTPINYRKIFERQDTSSSIVALVSRVIKPFSVIGGKSSTFSSDPFDVDQQGFNVEKRSGIIADLRKENPQLSDKIDSASIFLGNSPGLVGYNFNSGRHVLKPFIVDPRIANTVQPKTRLICAPFLKDKTSTKINDREFLQRPGIELIIRERLKDTIPDDQFRQDLQKIMSGEKSPNIASTSVDTQTLLLTLIALSDENDISNESNLETLQDLTSNEVIVITTLVRTLKGLIGKLNSAVSKIIEVKSEINWIPIPSAEGPEQGSKGAILDRTQATATAELDKRILGLKIQKINAEAKKTKNTNIGSFASPFEATPQNSNLIQINKDLKKEINKRDRLAHEAFIAMGDIERITGEASGLGLVDIIAAYIALWSMDLTLLLGLIDNRAFERLKKFNPELKNSAIEARGAVDSSGNPTNDIAECLQEFERNFKNVLSFADKELVRQKGNPINEDGGLI